MTNKSAPSAFAGRHTGGRHVGDLSFSTGVYPAGLLLAEHCHDRPILTVVLDGAFTEWSGRSRQVQCGASTVLFRAPFESHANEFSARVTRCFRVELSGEWMGRAALTTPRLRHSAYASGGMAAATARRLYDEARHGDEISPLILEALTLETLGMVIRTHMNERQVTRGSRWLREAVAFVHERFRGELRVTDVADSVHRHPVHLARAFRRTYGYSIGDLVRTLRVDAARRALEESEEPLTQVALGAGFSSQSAMCVTFRRLLGTTPTTYRESARTSSSPRSSRAR